jgi:glutaredoxin
MSFIVWTKQNCPQCEQAKQLLRSKGLNFEVRTIDGIQWTKDDLLKVAPEAKAVPQVFNEGTHIGGFSELKAVLG